MKEKKRKTAKKQPIRASNGDHPIQPTRKDNLKVMYYENTDKGIALLKAELQRIPPGFGSAVMYNCGTFRQTLAAIEKATKGLIGEKSKERLYRTGKDFWNGQNIFKGITVHRYNLQ